jgi:hypothetical protein
MGTRVRISEAQIIAGVICRATNKMRYYEVKENNSKPS